MKRLQPMLLALAGCAAQAQLPTQTSSLGQITLGEVHPSVLLPFSQIDLVGQGFPDPSRATARVHLVGQLVTGGSAAAVDLLAPATFVDGMHLSVTADDGFLSSLPARTGHLSARVSLVVDAALDGSARTIDGPAVEIDLQASLPPSVSAVTAGLLHVNDPVSIVGDGFLLATGEGETHALVSGCFQPDGAAACTPVAEVDLVARPQAPWDRQHLLLPFSPAIAGIAPGSFVGQVTVENRLHDGSVLRTPQRSLRATLEKPEIDSVTPTAASLGQLVDMQGGGFVGEAADEVTLLHLTGSFTRDGTTKPAPVDLQLVPRFVDGSHLRYVLDEDDALGKTIDLRRISGSFTGNLTPVTRKGSAEVTGVAAPVKLAIAPVKQVVYVRFLPSFVDSLRKFGLDAADADVRARVLAVAARDYAGVNIEFRAAPPDDFALYSQVDVAGPDPNNLGLLGYDNTPGKDVGNQRLFDKLGGVNATTQSDGFPGYGGIFAEEFLGFSKHPPGDIAPLPVDGDLFDRVFDALRPDTGTPAQLAETAAGVTALEGGGSCPADPHDRNATVACGVFVLGNLIGSTLTHEVGHSLGLADPTGELFHDPGDQPNRLMDAGDGRPFEERAELVGQGPAVFCTGEYVYLKTILPSKLAGPPVTRPGCN